MKKYAYGVDIGGTTVKIGFFETTGKLVDTWEIPTRTENDGELILPDIAESIKENNEKNSITTDDIEGIGMGVPGPVKDDGTVLKCVNLGWGVFNVEKAAPNRIKTVCDVGESNRLVAVEKRLKRKCQNIV